MAKRNRTTTQRKNEIRIEQGRGQGEGANYLPWLTIQDVPSEGRASRVKGWKTGRVHHLMSSLELMYFYLLDWSPIVTDIREQYPLLPLDRTLEIAEELGINHPKDPTSKEPIVMTTDFLITVEGKNGTEIWARTIKPLEKLRKRELEKFQIEQRYFHEQGVDWGIVTDVDIPQTYARNIESIHDCYHLSESFQLEKNSIEFLVPKLFRALTDSTLPLSKEALKQDEILGLEPGTSLFITKHMIAQKRWLVDMKTEELNFSRNLHLKLAGDNIIFQEGIG